MCLLIASCENKNSQTPKNQDVTNVTETNKDVNTNPKVQEPVQDTNKEKPVEKVEKKVEKKVIVAKPKNSNNNSDNNLKNLTIDNVIKAFSDEVNAAENCQELMKACRKFDNNVKRLSKNDENITAVSVEQRQDVRAIRKASEDKSLKMCQTQSLVK